MKWPSRRAPVSRNTDTTSSWVGMMCMFSVGSVSGEDAWDGAQQNLPVEREGPVVDVLHVHLHPGFEIHVVAARNGPQTRETGAHAETPPLPREVTLHFVGDGGPRSYQRHVAAQDVPQLRPFVDGELSQIPADRGEARIAGDLEGR